MMMMSAGCLTTDLLICRWLATNVYEPWPRIKPAETVMMLGLKAK